MADWRRILTRAALSVRSSGVLSRDFWRAHLDAVAYAACGLMLFIVFVVANFPYAETLSSILAPLGLKLSYADQSIRLPLGTELRGVRLFSTNDAGSGTLAEGADVALSPTLGSLLVGEPGVKVHAVLYGGDVRAAIYRSGRVIEVYFRADGLRLDRYPKFSQLGASLDGRLSGAGSAVLSNADLFQNQGEVKLAAKGLVVKMRPGFPPVRLGELSATLELKRAMVSIKRVESRGADLVIAAQGSIHLMPNLPRSQLDVKVRIEPTDSGRTRLRFLLGLLPHPPGPTPYALHGPIFAPSIN